jgi:saccharopine dehydrogenase-like NADP-dependent oxidoreductase
MVGSVMAADLAADPQFHVTVADARADAVDRALDRCRRAGADPDRLAGVCADLSSTRELSRVIADADVVLGALASVIGFQTLRTVIESGKNFCDICFMPEDAIDLDALAKQRGVTAIVDIGVAPGMSNMIAGYAAATLKPCENIEIYVGGLPRERRWPFQYKAAFSPYDVIEEYTRPSRIVEHGTIITREALSEPELLDFPHVGTLEAFNTDGLRSLAYTLKVPFMKEKTLRYPGHIELMRVLRHLGLFSHEPITVGRKPGQNEGGTTVRPIDVISALMFPKWTYEPGEEDLTVMRVSASGGGRTMTYDLFDVYDQKTQATSMARTTAFPCTIAARMVASGKYREPGVIPPEKLGAAAGMLEGFLKELEKRGVRYSST